MKKNCAQHLRKKLIVFSIAFAPLLAHSEIEKIATICGEKICFHWWPKLSPITGWHHDHPSSLHYNSNTLAPSGKNFSNAEAVMYAKAVYKPSVPDNKTLASFIDGDLQEFRSRDPDLKVTEESQLQTADKKTVRVFRFTPSKQGQWERVAYFEEGEYYMVFVISSRSEKGLSKSSSVYELLIGSYREKP